MERIKTPIFSKAVLAVEIMQEPQSNWEEKDSLSILKDIFVSGTDPSIFTSVAPVLLDWSNERSWISPSLKSLSHFLPQSAMSC